VQLAIRLALRVADRIHECDRGLHLLARARGIARIEQQRGQLHACGRDDMRIGVARLLQRDGLAQRRDRTVTIAQVAQRDSMRTKLVVHRRAGQVVVEPRLEQRDPFLCTRAAGERHRQHRLELVEDLAVGLRRVLERASSHRLGLARPIDADETLREVILRDEGLRRARGQRALANRHALFDERARLLAGTLW
jgi:hypothetical protein